MLYSLYVHYFPLQISENEYDLTEGFAQLTLVGATLPKQASTILKDVISVSLCCLHRLKMWLHQIVMFQHLKRNICVSLITKPELRSPTHVNGDHYE